MLRHYASENLNSGGGVKSQGSGAPHRMVLYARVSGKDREKEGYSIPA